MPDPSSKRRASRGDRTLDNPIVDGPPNETPSAVAPSIENEQVLPERPGLATTAQLGVFRVPDQPRPASLAGDAPPSKAPKVAIPRLRREAEETPVDNLKGGGRHRVSHACEPCRQRKTKCSGERPICKHCQDFKIACYYADGKRDRVKKQFGTMSEKVASYESLLNELSRRVSKEDAELIQRILDREAMKEISDSPSIHLVPPGSTITDTDDEPSGGESEASAGAGSTGAVDRIEEDFNRNEESRATGFMGKNSEITWMQRLRQENKLGSPSSEGAPSFQERSGGASALFESNRGPDSGPPLSDMYQEYTVAESSYHLDDFSVSIPDTVDPYEMPPKEMADNFFNIYMTTIHPSFPIIGKVTFTSQYRRFFAGPHVNPGPKWLAILNMLFAISARYSHLISAPWRGDHRDHLIYFTRARMLSLNQDTLFTHPDLQLVQVEGLTAFYLTATNQINRAWTIGGLAIRAAIALGLNMRNESTRTPDNSKEIRYRVWWSLYILEHQLSMLTGRPTSILDHVCTAPLPIPFEEESFSANPASRLLTTEMQKSMRFPITQSGSASSNTSSTPTSERSTSASKPTTGSRSPAGHVYPTVMDWIKEAPPCQSLYFLHLVELTRIKQDILNRLYTPDSMGTTWSTIQNIIAFLEDRLVGWLSCLPPQYDFTRIQREQNFLQQRISLGFFFYGTRITANRPCLCRLDRKIPRQSNKSKDFNRRSATICVDAARAMLDLIPDDPNPAGLYRLAPWWCILHHLVQATTVLMLELSFRADHMPEQAESILEASKKGVRWIYCLADESVAAARAWKLCDGLLRGAAPKIGGDVTDLPTHLPQKLPNLSMDGMPINSQFDLPFSPATLSRFDGLQGQMNMPLYTSYDQYLPQTSMGQSTQDYFPGAANMDFLIDELNNQGQPHQNFDMDPSGHLDQHPPK